MSTTKPIDNGLYRKPFIIRNAGLFRNGWNQMTLALDLAQSRDGRSGVNCRAHLDVTPDNMRALFALAHPQIPMDAPDEGYLADYLIGHVVIGVFLNVTNTLVAIEDIFGNDTLTVVTNKTAWENATATNIEHTKKEG